MGGADLATGTPDDWPPPWLPADVRALAEAMMANFPKSLRPDVHRVAVAAEMRGVWQTLARADVIGDTPAGWPPGVGGAMARLFDDICSLMPLFLQFPDDARYIDHFAPVINRDQRAAALALQLREVAAQLPELWPHTGEEKGLPLREMDSVWRKVGSSIGGTVSTLERIAHDLETAARISARTVYRPQGRNRGRMRERLFACNLARGPLTSFNLSDNARHNLIATVISVVFENEIEPYRVRDWLKPD
jgi:hypothetical protein